MKRDTLDARWFVPVVKGIFQGIVIGVIIFVVVVLTVLALSLILFLNGGVPIGIASLENP